MDKKKAKPTFLDELVEDHRKYTLTWDQFWKKIEDGVYLSDEAWSQLKSIVKWTRLFINEYHCIKEEQLLFPELQKNSRLTEGGPMCSLYFDGVMHNNPLNRVHALTMDSKPILPKPELTLYFEKNSPLTIPLQDHMASERLLESLELILKNEPSELELQKALSFARLHNEIERLHFLKEETCLFVFAPKLIDEETLIKLGVSAEKLKSKLQLDLDQLCLGYNF